MSICKCGECPMYERCKEIIVIDYNKNKLD